MRDALKEWAVICKALSEGRQTLILRKGGIAEPDGAFQLEQPRFWLYPTYVHQQAEGIREAARPWLAQVELEKPPPGVIRLTHFAEVAGVYHVKALAPALLLAHLHFCSDDVVRQRFAYKTPGLHVLLLRVFRAAQMIEMPETAYYLGCRSWVELERDLATDGAVPILTDEELANQRRQLGLLLNPTARV